MPTKLSEVRSAINVTPLVDVCLVLLIIFMAVSEKLTRGMDVPLPQTRYHTDGQQRDQPIVSLTSDAHIYWDRERVPDLAALTKRAGEALGRSHDRIYLKASAELTYGAVYPVLLALREAGSPGVELATQDAKDPAR